MCGSLNSKVYVICRSSSPPEGPSDTMFRMCEPSSCSKSTFKLNVSLFPGLFSRAAPIPIPFYKHNTSCSTPTSPIRSLQTHRTINRLARNAPTYPARPIPPHHLLGSICGPGSLLEHDLARHNTIFVLQHLAALNYGHKLLREPDFTLQTRPELGLVENRCRAGGVDARGVREVVCNHFGLVDVVCFVRYLGRDECCEACILEWCPVELMDVMYPFNVLSCEVSSALPSSMLRLHQSPSYAESLISFHSFVDASERHSSSCLLESSLY